MFLGPWCSARKVSHLDLISLFTRNTSPAGFLDGGDRTVMLSNQSSTPSPAPSLFDLDASTSVSSRVHSPAIMTPPESHTPDGLPVPSAPMPALLVSGLPVALFSSTSDLRPLLYPYGDVKKLQIIGSTTTLGSNTLSVLVEYSTLEQAREAHDMLKGQVYANQLLKVDFLDPLLQRPAGPVRLYSAPEINTRLNPHATPFSVASAAKSEISLRSPPDVNKYKLTHPVLVGSSQTNQASALPPPNTLYPPQSCIRPNSAPSLYVFW